jgi:hypothetical protein
MTTPVVKRQVIDTKAGNQFFGSGAFIGIVVAGGIFFLVVGLVTLYFYLQRKKELASTSSSSSSASSAATPSSGTALEDMKSAVYDPHTSSAAAPHSDLFNPLPLEPSGIYDAVDTSSPGTAGSNQYAKLPVTKEQLRASEIHAAAANAAADVNDEEYGQLELFKAAEGTAAADVNRDGYGIISQSLIKQPSEKKMKTKKSKSKVALDTAAVTTARAADDLMKSARHEYGSPNLPVVGQYSNTPEAPPADHPAAPKGRKVAFQTVAFGKNSDAAAAAAAEDADDAKPAAAPFKTVAFGGAAKPLPAKPAPAKPAVVDDDVPAVTSKTVAFGKMPPKPTGGGATMAFGSGSAATGGQTMFLPETMVLARPAAAAAASAAMQTAQDNDDDGGDDAAAVAESRAAMKTKKKSSKKLKTGKSATSLKSAQREPPAVASRTVAFGRADIARAAEEQNDSLPAIDL